MSIIGPTNAKMVPSSVDSQQLKHGGIIDKLCCHMADYRPDTNLDYNLCCLHNLLRLKFGLQLTRQALHLHHVLHSARHAIQALAPQTPGGYLKRLIVMVAMYFTFSC